MGNESGHPLEEGDRPLTHTPGRLTDVYGENVYVDEDDPEEAIEDDEEQGIGVGAPIAQAIVGGGLYNGDWLQGPPDPDAIIDDDNPLPYWRFTADTGSSITVRRVVDAASASGFALQWTIADAATSDLAYIEQIIPVSGTEEVRYPRIRTSTGASPQIEWYRELQPLKVDGTTTGGAFVPTLEWDIDETPESLTVGQRLVQVIPADARFLRVRFGIQTSPTTPPATNPDTVNLREVWCGFPQIVYTTLQYVWGGSGALPSTGVQNATLDEANNAGDFYLDAPAWVKHFMMDLKTGRSSGTLTAVLRETASPSGNHGPTLTFNGSNTDHDMARASADASTNLITSLGILAIRLEVTSGTYSPTTDNATASVTLAMVPDAT